MPEKQKKEVQELLQKYADIFTEKPGETTLEHHRIETTTETPIKVRPYQMPFMTRDLIRKEVDSMLEAGIIEPSNSAYGSPVVLVKKKDGSNRVCMHRLQKAEPVHHVRF